MAESGEIQRRQPEDADDISLESRPKSPRPPGDARLHIPGVDRARAVVFSVADRVDRFGGVIEDKLQGIGDRAARVVDSQRLRIGTRRTADSPVAPTISEGQTKDQPNTAAETTEAPKTSDEASNHTEASPASAAASPDQAPTPAPPAVPDIASALSSAPDQVADQPGQDFEVTHTTSGSERRTSPTPVIAFPTESDRQDGLFLPLTPDQGTDQPQGATRLYEPFTPVIKPGLGDQPLASEVFTVASTSQLPNAGETAVPDSEVPATPDFETVPEWARNSGLSAGLSDLSSRLYDAAIQKLQELMGREKPEKLAPMTTELSMLQNVVVSSSKQRVEKWREATQETDQQSTMSRAHAALVTDTKLAIRALSDGNKSLSSIMALSGAKRSLRVLENITSATQETEDGVTTTRAIIGGGLPLKIESFDNGREPSVHIGPTLVLGSRKEKLIATYLRPATDLARLKKQLEDDPKKALDQLLLNPRPEDVAAANLQMAIEASRMASELKPKPGEEFDIAKYDEVQRLEEISRRLKEVGQLSQKRRPNGSSVIEGVIDGSTVSDGAAESGKLRIPKDLHGKKLRIVEKVNRRKLKPGENPSTFEVYLNGERVQGDDAQMIINRYVDLVEQRQELARDVVRSTLL